MDDLHARISRRAHGLWEKEGKPHGRDQEFWERAESMEREAAKPAKTTPLQKRSKAEAKVDAAVADTFPASDPPAASAATGSRKAKAAPATAKKPAPEPAKPPPKPSPKPAPRAGKPAGRGKT